MGATCSSQTNEEEIEEAFTRQNADAEDLLDPRTEHKLELQGHSGQVLCVAVFPDGLKVATASRDETSRIWDAVSRSRHP